LAKLIARGHLKKRANKTGKNVENEPKRTHREKERRNLAK